MLLCGATLGLLLYSLVAKGTAGVCAPSVSDVQDGAKIGKPGTFYYVVQGMPMQIWFETEKEAKFQHERARKTVEREKIRRADAK